MIRPKWLVCLNACLLFTALSGAVLLPDVAWAAAPQVKTQAPGFYRVMVGDFEVTAQRSRRYVLQLAAQRRYLIGAAHIAFPGLGHIRENGGEYEWVPVNYEAAPGQ